MIVIVLALSSFIYKSKQSNIYERFPFEQLVDLEGIETPFYLFLFFSKQNCAPCLDVIEVLNQVPEHFKVIGIVPERELIDEEDLRDITGVNFKLIGHKKYERFIPQYAPTIVGVSQNNKIFFVLPGVPYEKEYFEKFLAEFYQKAYPLLVEH